MTVVTSIGSADLGDEKGATFSDDGRHRYLLWRVFRPETGPGQRALYVGQNPSYAGVTDDATVRRFVGFARMWGFAGIDVVNMASLVTPHPRELAASDEPVGPDNEAHVRDALARDRVGLVVVCWGNVDRRLSRPRHDCLGLIEDAVANGWGAVDRAHCFGLTAAGEPRHPVRLPYATRLEVFVAADPRVVGEVRHGST